MKPVFARLSWAAVLFVTLAVTGCGGGGAGSGDGYLGPTPLASQAIHADIPFAEYSSGISLQALGAYPTLNSLADAAGFTGPNEVLGSKLRFGKVDDPKATLIKGAVRKVFRLAIRDDDPPTAGSAAIRVDAIVPNGKVGKDVTYWIAFEVYIPAQTYAADDYTTLVNIHPGDDGGSGNWGFACELGEFTYVRANPLTGQNTYFRISTANAPPDTWLKVVVKFQLSGSNAGFSQAWINNGSGMVQIVNDSGPNSPAVVGDYMKMAFYNYSWLSGYGDHSRPQRELFYRSVLSPIIDTGQTAAQIEALLV